MSAPLPLPLRWALNALCAHPHVSDVRIEQVDTAARTLHVRLMVRTEMPTRWGGIGALGTRRLEPITLELPLSYPSRPPRFTLRQDFHRGHPHIQPGRASEPPVPCLVDHDPRETIFARGGLVGMLDQLVRWLDRASRHELISGSDGWEPARRDRIDDHVIVGADEVRSRAKRRAGGRWFETRVASFRLHDVDGWMHYASFDAASSVTLDRAFRGFQVPLAETEELVPGLAIVVWPDGARITDLYCPDTVDTLEGLRQQAHYYGCRTLDLQLARLNDLVREAPTVRQFVLVVVLMARRPTALIGGHSSLEILPYTIDMNHLQTLELPTTAVRPAAQREPLSAALLRSTSARGPARVPSRWALVGCGSVGSKIAMHLARSGTAPNTVIDQERLEPHNFARHATLPKRERAGLPLPVVVATKAEQLADDIRLLDQKVDAQLCDVATLLDHEEGIRKLTATKPSMLVNTTASVAVREAISAARWKSRRPHVVEMSLMGSGRVGYFSSEGRDANPSVSDVMASFYHLLSNRPDLASRVFDGDGDEVSLGQGCSSRTMILSDAKLSCLTASLAVALESELASIGRRASGILRIGVVAEDGLTQAWEQIDVQPFEVVVEPARHRGIYVRIARSVVERIDADVAEHPGVETGGILVGRFSEMTRTFQVVDVFPAPPDSERSATRFVLGREAVIRERTRLQSASRDALQLLGTWHNHLADTDPSPTDRETAMRLADTQTTPALVLIRTPKRFRFAIGEREVPVELEGIDDIVGNGVE